MRPKLHLPVFGHALRVTMSICHGIVRHFEGCAVSPRSIRECQGDETSTGEREGGLGRRRGVEGKRGDAGRGQPLRSSQPRQALALKEK
jgi:hypothetical protein